jgi:hypothetical protein
MTACVARAGRRSTAPDRHSAYRYRTGDQAGDANADHDHGGEVGRREGVARRAVQEQDRHGDEHDDG